MRYFKTFKEPNAERREVPYEEALWTMIGSYKDNRTTRKMLQTVGTYPTRFAVIEVEE